MIHSSLVSTEVYIASAALPLTAYHLLLFVSQILTELSDQLRIHHSHGHRHRSIAQISKLVTFLQDFLRLFFT